MADGDKKTVKAKDNKPSFWQGVKREWRKIMWPTRQDIIKRTGLVVVLSLILGVIISVVDGAAMYVVDLLLAL